MLYALEKLHVPIDRRRRVLEAVTRAANTKRPTPNKQDLSDLPCPMRANILDESMLWTKIKPGLSMIG
jgi:hypothetical protein